MKAHIGKLENDPPPRKDNHFLRSINVALEIILRWVFVGMIFMDGLKSLNVSFLERQTEIWSRQKARQTDVK